MIATQLLNGDQRIRFLLGEEHQPRERLSREQWNAPHLFVGIGGTGTQAVTAIAERLQVLASEALHASNALPGCLQFLAFDTDSSELSDRVRKAGVEVVDLTVSNPEVVWQENEEAFRGLGFVAPIRVEMGAGGRRKHGRFAFIAHAEQIKQSLESALAEAQRYPGLEHNRDPRIHVFFSIVGGTGCGAFLDLAFLIRDLTENMPRAEVYGYLVFPDNIAATVSGRTMASAAAAFKEAEYFMQLERGSPAFEGWAKAPRSGERLVYWQGNVVRGLVRRPFDVCYLFGSAGDGQGAVSQPADFPGVLAEAALRNGFSEAGDWNRRRVIDLTHHFDKHWNGKHHSFSAIGYSRLVLPTEDLNACFVLELARDMCDYLLDGPPKDRRRTGEAEALESASLQKLTARLSLDQVVSPQRRPMLDGAAVVGELEVLFKRKDYNRIKQACDALPTLADAVWSESEETRQAAFDARRQMLQEMVVSHINDLHGGLREDLAHFTGLRTRLLERHAELLESAERAKLVLERRLPKVPPAAKFLQQTGVGAWLTRDAKFNQLKGHYQAALAEVRECLLARAAAELAGVLVQEADIQLVRLSRLCGHLANDLQARYEMRRAWFKSRLAQMRFGKGASDCKTFCPVEMEQIEPQAERMLRPVRSKFGALLEQAVREGRLQFDALATGGPHEIEAVRVQLLRMLLPEVALEHLWRTLASDPEDWDRSLQEHRRKTLVAASPMVRFGASPRAGVIGCYANIPPEELNRFHGAPADLGHYQRHNLAPLAPQSECCEATRFFHGLRLRDLAIASEMGRQYRAYMEDFRRAANGTRAVDDHVNLFETLTDWTAPDEPAPKTAEDDLLRLWALGQCFAEIFAPDEQQQAALENANDLAPAYNQSPVKGRKNFIFHNGSYYYVQPFYQSPADAPKLIQLGAGRENAYAAFRASAEASAEMAKWYDHVAHNWTSHFTLPELKDAVRGYLKDLNNGNSLVLKEREVVRDFVEKPFPE